ncbi:hypothetical protein AGMMS49975_20590 [Clostridia bacterium]|nr:hypothetical protein AGMMS49975_20590 [Clostridia bacterium]
MFDPGMGKTYAIAMGLKSLFLAEPKRKCIFFIKKAQITQTSNDISMYTGLRVVTCTAEADELSNKLYRNVSSYDILMITHEALHIDRFGLFLYQYAKDFNICVVDEAHYLTNIHESDRVVLLAAFLSRIERVAFLTATPFISKPEQFAELLNIMDGETFARTDKIVKKLNTSGRVDLDYPLQIYNYDRKLLGIENTYDIRVSWVDPHPFQLKLKGNHILQEMMGEGAENQLAELLRILRMKIAEEKKGIVFVYYHDTREWLLPRLDEVGVKYGCIHGDTPQGERDRVQKEFQDGLLDVVIISVTTSINLDCDYIVFYQYTLEIKQILGRGERGLNPKLLELYFIFTRKTKHAMHFLETVYKLSREVRCWIGKTSY